MELELFVSMPEITLISGILFSTIAKFALESLSRLSYTLDMKQVSREEFWKVIGPLNVQLRLDGQKYPYVSIFRFSGIHGSSEDVKGKIIPNKDSWDNEPKEYYVSDDLVQK